MTGCNNFCSYCVVPYARGRENSRTTKEIIKEVNNLVKQGYKAITLLGQNINSYLDNTSTEKIDFPKLLQKINTIPGNFWIWFITSHPKDMSDQLINIIAACDKICNYIHLPVQAGNNQILKMMNRGYTKEKFVKLVNKIRDKIRDCSISTDTIVGFPQETEKQFQDTVDLYQKLKFDMAYIAQYSERPGTSAAKLKDNVPCEEKKRREKALTDILEKIALENNKKLVGKELQVLAEKFQTGFLQGKTAAFKTVKFKGGKDLIGRFVNVKITRTLDWGLEGKICVCV
jgi:tRNA-2-methylthio-N6-dimethylallyladenosine synthase